MKWDQIVITSIIAGLLLLTIHYLPLRGLLKKNLHQTINYMIGVAAIELPLTVLLYSWQNYQVIIALWIITSVGGLAVVLAYLLDNWISTHQRMQAAEWEANELRPGGQHGQAQR